MDYMLIEATKSSPHIELDPKGEMILKGRSILEDTITFYKPVMDWVKNVNCPQFSITVRVEYMNTSSSKQVLMLLKALIANSNIKNVNIKWFYEEDDEDMYETGKDFETILRTPFKFYAFVDEPA